jgi:TRAP-type C4-dicarboxylate transport system substrate-binding protein
LGVEDSAENDLATLFSQHQHTAANGKNLTETRHDYTTRLLLTSGRFWEGLSDQQKEWVTAAVAASGAEVLTAFTHSDDAARTGILAGGAPVIPFGDVDIASFRAIATPIQDKFARDNHVESLLQAARAADSGN